MDVLYEPDGRDLQIADDLVCRAMTTQQVADKYKLSQRQVFNIKKNVCAWLREEFIGEVHDIRDEHTVRLQHHYTELMKSWHESIGRTVKKTVKSTTSGESDDLIGGIETTEVIEIKGGEVGYISEARACLADIRKIWGVDVNPKARAEDDDEFRVAGRSTEDLMSEIHNRIQALIPSEN